MRMRASAQRKQRTVNVDEGCFVQIAFRYPVAASEDDSEADIGEIHILEIDELVTDCRDRKPLLDHGKKPLGEDTSQDHLLLVGAVGSPRHC
jgi:hypothetical protein